MSMEVQIGSCLRVKIAGLTLDGSTRSLITAPNGSWNLFSRLLLPIHFPIQSLQMEQLPEKNGLGSSQRVSQNSRMPNHREILYLRDGGLGMLSRLFTCITCCFLAIVRFSLPWTEHIPSTTVIDLYWTWLLRLSFSRQLCEKRHEQPTTVVSPVPQSILPVYAITIRNQIKPTPLVPAQLGIDHGSSKLN